MQGQRAGLEWKPFLLGGLFNDTGVKPAIEIDNKFAYIKQDTQDSAKHYGAEFKFPAIFPLNSVKSMRGAFAASEKGKLAEYNHEMFRLYLTEGRDLSKDDVLKEAVAGVGLDPEWFIARIAEQDIKDRLREETSKAAARGAFGAPTIFIGEKMFWGNDRLDYADDFLKGKL
jgi:2-hydroxychromene-2-carboxylate isomerase